MSNETKTIWVKAHEIGLAAMAKAAPFIVAWVFWLGYGLATEILRVTDHEKRITSIEKKLEIVTENLQRLTTNSEITKTDVAWIKANLESRK